MLEKSRVFRCIKDVLHLKRWKILAWILIVAMMFQSLSVPSLFAYGTDTDLRITKDGTYTADGEIIVATDSDTLATDSDALATDAEALLRMAGDTTLKVTLDIFNLESDDTRNDDSTFWVETNIKAVADVQISGENGKLNHPWVVLTVPKTNKTNQPTFVDSQNAKQTIRILKDDPDNYYVIYQFDELVGGTSMTFPFPFKFSDANANDGDSITVNLDLYSGMDEEKVYEDDGTTLDNEKFIAWVNETEAEYHADKTYIAKKQEFTYTQSHTWQTAMSGTASSGNTLNDGWNDFIFFRKLTVKSGTTKTSAEGEKVSTALDASYRFVDVTGTISYKKETNLQYTLTLPENVDPPTDILEAKGSVQKGDATWTWDSETRKLVGIRTKLNRYNPLGFRRLISTEQWIDLYYKNIPFDETVTIPVNFKVNAGLESEFSLPDRVIQTQFRAVYFSQASGFRVYKDNLTGNGTDPFPYSLNEGGYIYYGKKLYDSKGRDMSENGLYYRSSILATNNGSAIDDKSGGIVKKVYTIEDDLYTNVANPTTYPTYYHYFILNTPKKYSSFYTDEEVAPKLEAAIKVINEGNTKLYGIKADGDRVLIHENVQIGEKITIDDESQDYIRLQLDFEKPIVIDNMIITYDLSVYPTKEELAKFDAGTYGDERIKYYGKTNIYGYSTTKLDEEDDEKKKYEQQNYGNWGYTSLGGLYPQSDIATSGNQVLPYSASGTYVTINSIVNLSGGTWGPLYNDTYKGKLMLLLPLGFNYHKKVSQSFYGTNIGDPEVITNYKNTGRTAVIYSADIIPANNKKNAIEVKTQIEATSGTSRGDNQVDVYFIYDKNDIIMPRQTQERYVDALDLDNDADRTEIFAHASSIVTYVPPLEMLMTKEVGYSIEEKDFGTMAVGDMGYSIYYKIRLFNNTIRDIESVSVLDVLPYEGDHTIAPNQDGIYLQRGSEYTTTLTKPLEEFEENKKILDRFEFFYQTTSQGDDLDSIQKGDWIPASSIAEWESVKSIKIVLKPGKKIVSKEEVYIYIPAKIPFDTNLMEGIFAVNSAAFSTNGGTSYIEGNSVSLTFVTYKIHGVVFKDYDKDGLIDTGDVGVANRKVELIDLDTGDIALDCYGNAYPSQYTDENGAYSFDVYRRGGYSVRFTLEPGEEFTPSQNSSTNGSNIKPSTISQKSVRSSFYLSTRMAASFLAASILSGETTGLSAEANDASLMPTATSDVRNAGIVSSVRDVELLKISTETDEDGNQIVLEGATFELRSGDEVLQTATTDENGKLTFTEVEFGTYTLVETVAPTGYEINESSREITIGETDIGIQTFTNTPIVQDVTLTKVNADDASILLEGVIYGLFSIASDGTVADTASYTATTNAFGVATFSGVAYGIYRLKEISTIDGYILDTGEGTTVEVLSNAQGTIDVGTLTNEPIKGRVEVKKVDADDANIVLEGVVFALTTSDGSEITATTDASGVAIFTDLAYGTTYTLSEKTALENYNASTLTHEFRVTSTDTLTYTYTNELIKGSLIVTKVDADDTSILLEGVTFILTNTETMEEQTATTDASGTAIFTDILYGTYTLTESETLENYVLSSEEIPISITEDGQSERVIVENTKKKGTVTLVKADTDSPSTLLEGVTFTLSQDGDVVYTATTNALGVATFTDVIYGSYILKETQTLTPYVLSADTQTVEIIRDGQVLDLGTIYNTKKKSTILVTKVDADDTTVMLEGITFILKSGEETIATATTNSAGVATFENIPYGDYTLVEESTITGYVLSTETKTISVTEDGATIESGNFTNTKIKGNIEVLKIDEEDSTLTLSGVVFGLFALDSEGNISESASYLATSSEAGIARFSDVIYGTYVLKEVSTIEGYVLTETQTTVTISENGITLDLIEYTNRKIRADVVLAKVGVDELSTSAINTVMNYFSKLFNFTSLALEGAEFVLKQDDVIKYRATSDADGIVRFSDVLYGTYILEEVASVDGYILNTQTQEVTVTTDGIEVNLGNFENEIIKGSITFKKVDASDGSVIEGAIFVLTRDGKVIYTATSDADGIVTFSDVIYGSYVLKESAVNDTRYTLSDEERAVTISEDGVILTLDNFTNTKVKTNTRRSSSGSSSSTSKIVTTTTVPQIEVASKESNESNESNEVFSAFFVPKTGDRRAIYLYVWLLVTSLAGICSIVLKRRKKK